jgi:hypothetical protein
VKSGTVEMTESTIHNIIASRNTPRRHAKAMSIEAINTVFAWSLGRCPGDRQAVLEAQPASMAADAAKEVTLHLFWRAFSSLAFKLWTRCALGAMQYFSMLNLAPHVVVILRLCDSHGKTSTGITNSRTD